MLDHSSELVLGGPVAALKNTHGGIILKDSDDFKSIEMGQRTLNPLLMTSYSPSPKIDTPKIDTFYENSRNFRNSKIFGEVLSKSPILGQNHKNDDLFSDFNI